MAAGGASWGKRAFGRGGAGAVLKRARATGRGAGGDVVLGGPRGGRCEVGSARGAALCGREKGGKHADGVDYTVTRTHYKLGKPQSGPGSRTNFFPPEPLLPPLYGAPARANCTWWPPYATRGEQTSNYTVIVTAKLDLAFWPFYFSRFPQQLSSRRKQNHSRAAGAKFFEKHMPRPLKGLETNRGAVKVSRRKRNRTSPGAKRVREC